MGKAHISDALRRQIARDSRYHCGYCLTPQFITGQKLVPDHIIPESAGGSTSRANLWLACRSCNEHKGTRVAAIDPGSGERVSLFNPRLQTWRVHFMWSDDGTEIVGLTACGRATVAALNMNREVLVSARKLWVQTGWHPPAD